MFVDADCAGLVVPNLAVPLDALQQPLSGYSRGTAESPNGGKRQQKRIPCVEVTATIVLVRDVPVPQILLKKDIHLQDAVGLIVTEGSRVYVTRNIRHLDLPPYFNCVIRNVYQPGRKFAQRCTQTFPRSRSRVHCPHDREAKQCCISEPFTR